VLDGPESARIVCDAVHGSTVDVCAVEWKGKFSWSDGPELAIYSFVFFFNKLCRLSGLVNSPPKTSPPPTSSETIPCPPLRHNAAEELSKNGEKCGPHRALERKKKRCGENEGQK